MKYVVSIYKKATEALTMDELVAGSIIEAENDMEAWKDAIASVEWNGADYCEVTRLG